MNRINEILRAHGLPELGQTSKSIEEMAVEDFNSTPGSLEGYNCPVCLNKGTVAVLIDGEDHYKTCECVKARRQIELQKKSGIADMMGRYRLDNYQTEEPWQEHVLNSAQEYLKTGGWFYIGGQVGSGKTHICTAICGELLRKGVEVKYMLWRNEASRLKAKVNDDEYETLMKPLREARVLYIDDFFKGGVTTGDTNLAFEIINDRYNKGLATVISSEKTLMEVLEIDEAIGSRINERSTCVLNVSNKSNWRLKNSGR